MRLEGRLGVTVNARELAFGTLEQVAAACEERAQLDESVKRDGSPKRAGWMRSILGRLVYPTPSEDPRHGTEDGERCLVRRGATGPL